MNGYQSGCQAFRAGYYDIKVCISEGPSAIAIPCFNFRVLNYSYNAHVIAYSISTTFILLQYTIYSITPVN